MKRLGSRLTTVLATLTVGVWLGILLTVGFIVAPYLFMLAARPDTAISTVREAGDIIGPLLHLCAWISLVLGLSVAVATAIRIMLARSAAKSRRVVFVAAVVASCIAALDLAYLTPRLSSTRTALYAIEDSSNPAVSLRQAEFDRLHATSTILFCVLCAMVATVSGGLSWDRPMDRRNRRHARALAGHS